MSALLLAIPGIGMGWLLARRTFRGKTLLSALVSAPMVLPPVVVGYVLLTFLGSRSTFGAWLESAFGLRLAFTWVAAVVASCVVAFPLMVRSARTALELVDPTLEQAAATMGRTPVAAFLTTTLPLALPGILGGLALAFARSLGEFGATVTFAGNVPGRTDTLPLAMYNLLQSPGGERAAMALSGVSLLLSVATIAVAEALTRRARKNVEALHEAAC
jgi:molybdate transport system permease protein